MQRKSGRCGNVPNVISNDRQKRQEGRYAAFCSVVRPFESQAAAPPPTPMAQAASASNFPSITDIIARVPEACKSDQDTRRLFAEFRSAVVSRASKTELTDASAALVGLLSRDDGDVKDSALQLIEVLVCYAPAAAAGLDLAVLQHAQVSGKIFRGACAVANAMLQSSIHHVLDVSKTGSAASRKDAKDLVSAALKLRSALVAVATPAAAVTAEVARLGTSGSSMLGIVKLLESTCIALSETTPSDDSANSSSTATGPVSLSLPSFHLDIDIDSLRREADSSLRLLLRWASGDADTSGCREAIVTTASLNSLLQIARNRSLHAPVVAREIVAITRKLLNPDSARNSVCMTLRCALLSLLKIKACAHVHDTCSDVLLQQMQLPQHHLRRMVDYDQHVPSSRGPARILKRRRSDGEALDVTLPYALPVEHWNAKDLFTLVKIGLTNFSRLYGDADIPADPRPGNNKALEAVKSLMTVSDARPTKRTAREDDRVDDIERLARSDARRMGADVQRMMFEHLLESLFTAPETMRSGSIEKKLSELLIARCVIATSSEQKLVSGVNQESAEDMFISNCVENIRERNDLVINWLWRTFLERDRDACVPLHQKLLFFSSKYHVWCRYTQSLCNFLTKLIATGDDKKGLYLHVIVRKIPCAPAACLQLLETTFRFVA
jgi:hypothetical protein